MNSPREDTIDYSATVNLWLEHSHFGRIPLVQVATTFIIAAMAQNLPAGNAKIIMSIDGREYTRPVSLAQPMNNCRKAMILSRDDISPF